jgi:putative inorganic carbon (HCO3(-)) transporter
MKISFQNATKLILSLEIWVVSAAVFLSILKTSLLPWPVLAAVIFWPLRWQAYGYPSKRTPIDLGVALLVFMLPVTLWATALPEKTIPQVYRLALGILFFYALINWTYHTKRLSWILSGIILAGLALAGMAIFSVQFASTKLSFIPAGIYQRFELLVSDTIHPNVMAGNIVIIIPIGIALLFFCWRQMKFWQVLLLSFISLTTTGILVLTQSRGAIIAFGGALLIIVILRGRRGWVAIPLSLITVVFLIHQVGLSTMLDFISSGISVEGISGRVEIWSRAIFMIQDFSFTGVGMGSFMDVADLLYPFFLASPGKIVHAHNVFLQIAVDLGIPGLIAWLSIFLGICLSGWQLYKFGKDNHDSWVAGLGVGFLGSQLALVIHGMFDAVTWG